jgi:hypothetical protein
MTRLTLVLAVFSALSFAGCQTVAPDWSKKWNVFAPLKLKESKYAVPARLAILWSPAVLNQAGQVPTRGFGGRVYFYDSKNKPVPVEGQLVIYAYHNDKPNPDSKVPDRKFAYTPEQFIQHYTPTELGASYSIWIPWDAAGQPQAEISLVPIFTSTSGALVMGQPSRGLLPGPSTLETKSYVTNCTLPGALTSAHSPALSPQRVNDGVQQASFVSHPPANGPPAMTPPGSPQFHDQNGLSTMSITLPGSMADQLAHAAPQTSLMQKMAALRQEAIDRQSGKAGLATAPPTAAKTAAPVTATFGGVPQPWFPAQPQPTRSGQPAPPALGGPTLPQAGGPLPSQPFPAARPSAPPG